MSDLLYKGYRATPITIDDWKLLGKYLRGFLLDDMPFQQNAESRFVNQDIIQMRDYDRFDVIRHLGREDMRYKFYEIMFKNDNRVMPKLYEEFDNDEDFFKFRRELLAESGINFIEEKQDENPPPIESEDSAKSA